MQPYQQTYSKIWYFSTDYRAAVPYGWEGNRRFGVAFVKGHKLERLSTYELELEI